MYQKHPNSETLDIQGAKCHLPPVGQGIREVRLPDNRYDYVLEPTETIKRSEKAKEQYWEREPLPDWYIELRQQEEMLQQDSPYYFDHKCEEYRQREWGRRLRGVWFWNKGRKVYLTGMHYMYLQWWTIDIGFPSYRECDRLFFYFLQLCIEDPNSLGMLSVAKRKSGKCFGINTPIRMYDGSVKMVQDISNGELVMGNDSTARKVYGVTSGQETMYRVTPNKGDSFTCNESHILALIWNGSAKHSVFGWEKDQLVNISVEKYLGLKDWEKDHLVMYRAGWGSDWESVQHELPPYLLGLYLGDGVRDGKRFATNDKEIIDYLGGYCSDNSLNLKKISPFDYRLTKKDEAGFEAITVHEGTTDRFFTSISEAKDFYNEANNVGALSRTKFGRKYRVTKHNTFNENKYTQSLQRLNLIQNKHIPQSYLKDSVKNRLDLLAGLIDTDGHLDFNKRTGKYKCYEITQKSKIISDGIVELCRSLGFYTSMIEKDATMKRTDGTIYKCLVYRISIYGDLSRIPCKVERKQCPKVDRRKDSLRFGFTIENIGEGDYYGFAVDNNHLFLLSDGTVVHNTARSGIFLYEFISRQTRVHGGIQSKSDGDAAEVFAKAVIQPWRELPHFFRPIYDTLGGDNPDKGIKFFAPSKKGVNATTVSNQHQFVWQENFSLESKKPLASWIDFKARGALAYDGPHLHRYVSDECGKLRDVDINKRHNVVKFCSYVNGRHIGKHLYTTTVEEIEDGGDRFKKLWDMSDHTTANGSTTPSGLYRYFEPAYTIDEVDIYGFTDENANRKRHEEERAKAKAFGSQADYYGIVRRNAFTIEEAFKFSNQEGLYDTPRLYDRIDALEIYTGVLEKGNFVWKGGVQDTTVIWEKNSSGRWTICWKFPEDKESKLFANNVTRMGNVFVPNNKTEFVIGSDPFSHNVVVDDRRKSLAAALVKRKNDPTVKDEFNDAFVCLYHSRPPTVTMYHEDMIKMAVFYGCQILFENNKNNWEEYFKMRGYERFLMKLPDYTGYGIPGNDKTAERIVDLTEEYINNNLHRVFFASMMRQWIQFDFHKRTAFDIAMAAGYTLIADHKNLYKKMGDDKTIRLDTIFKLHKIA